MKMKTYEAQIGFDAEGMEEDALDQKLDNARSILAYRIGIALMNEGAVSFDVEMSEDKKVLLTAHVKGTLKEYDKGANIQASPYYNSDR